MAFLIYDTYVRLRGGLVAAAVGKLSLLADATRDSALQQRVMQDFMAIAHEASSDLGEDHLDVLVIGTVALTHRSKLGIFDDTFLASVQRIIPHATRRYMQYLNISLDGWYDQYHDHWVYRSCYYMLAKYYATRNDLAKVANCCQIATGLEYGHDNWWKMFANACEDVLRGCGLTEQAAILAAQRQAHDMPPEVREALEKEEIPATDITSEELVDSDEDDDN